MYMLTKIKLTYFLLNTLVGVHNSETISLLTVILIWDFDFCHHSEKVKLNQKYCRN